MDNYQLILDSFYEYLEKTNKLDENAYIDIDQNGIVKYKGYTYKVILKNDFIFDELWQEPIGNTKKALIFPYNLRKGNFFFCMWSRCYGYNELGPYESYHDAMLDMHSIKGKVMMRDDGVNRFYSDIYKKCIDPVLFE